MRKNFLLHAIALASASVLTGGEAIAGDDPDKPGYTVLGDEDEIAPSGAISNQAFTMKCQPTKSGDSSWIGYAPALRGIAIGERIDKPIYRKTYCRNLNAKGRTMAFDSDWKRASPEDPESPGQSYEAVFPSGSSIDDSFYVTGIKVCTNGNKDSQKARIKGIEVFGSKLDRNTAKVKTGSADTTSISKELTNCKDWETRKNCPANEVAVGWKGYWTMEGMVSIALVCRPLTWKNGYIRPLE